MAADKPKTTATSSGKAKDGEAVVIKKYANRRLYNTSTSAYVTLEDLAGMVREGIDFVVFDARTNDELTRQILTQIIFEEESRGEALLPVQFLRQLIGFYGGQMQGVLPGYLEMSLESFSRQQEQFRSQMTRAFGVVPPTGLGSAMGTGVGTGMGASFMEDAVKNNMAMFERALKMFPGFTYVAGDSDAPKTEAEPEASASGSAPETDDAMSQMRAQMDEMRAQIERLAAKGQKT